MNFRTKPAKIAKNVVGAYHPIFNRYLFVFSFSLF
jgi:hypothetical protein